MAKFLNLDGLIYFWGRIKSYIDTGLNGKANSSHTHLYAGSSTAGGSATTALTLANSRTIQTNLASTTSVGFNGSTNITPGVTGTLPIGNGGTGATTAAAARTALGVAYGTAAGTVCQGNDSRLSNARTPVAHNQAASTITAGTFAGQVVAPAGTEYTTARMRNIAFTTTDPGANTASSLPNGSVLIVYE